MTAERTSLLVLGMHRSGTSAVTRMLNLLGYDLPGTLLGGNEASNPTGHWESKEVNRLNDEILESAGTHWRRLETVGPEWYASPRYGEMRGQALDLLAREYGDSRRFVLKDPRVCRLVPFWLSVLDEFGAPARIVSVTRSVGEVVASLKVRNHFDTSFGEIMWLRYVLDGEAGGRGRERVHLTYDDVLADWSGAAEAVREKLGIVFPAASDETSAAIGQFLSPEHRHHVEDTAANGDRAGRQWLAHTSEIVNRWAASGENEADYAELDRIRADLNGAIAEVGAPLAFGFETTIEARKLREMRSDLTAKLKSAEEQSTLIQEALAREQERASAEQSRRKRLETEAAAARESVAALEGRLATARKEAGEAAGRLDAANADLAKRDAALSELRATASQLVPLKEQLAVATRDVASSRLEAEHRAREHEQAVVAATKLETEIERLRQRADRDAEKIETLHAKGADLVRAAASNEASANAAQGAARDAMQRYDRALVTAAGARSNLAQARARAATLAERIIRLEQQIEEQTAGAAAIRSALDMERAKASELGNTLRERQARNEADAAVISAARDRQAKLEIERDALSDEHGRAVAALAADLKRAQIEREAALAAGEAQRARLATEQEEARAAFEAELGQARADRAALIAAAEAERGRLAADLERALAGHAEEVERMRLDRKTARAEAEGERARLAQDHERALASLKIDLDRAHADREAIVEMRAGERTRLIEDYERAIGAITAELGRSRGDRDAAMAAADTERRRLAEDHTRALGARDADLKQARLERDAGLADAAMARTRLVEDHAKALADRDALLERDRAEQTAALAEANADRARLVEEHGRALIDRDQALERLHAEHAAAIAAHGADLERLRGEQDAALAEHGATLAEHAATLDHLRAEHAGALALAGTARDAASGEVERATARIATLEGELEQLRLARTAAQESGKAERIRLVDNYDRALGAATAELDGARAEQGRLIANHGLALAVLQGEIERERVELAAAAAIAAEDHARAVAEHLGAIDEANAEVQRTRTALGAANAERTRLIAEHGNAMSVLGAELTRTRGELQTTIKRFDDERAHLAEERDGTVAMLDAELERLRTEQAEALADFETERASLVEKHDGALGSLDEELARTRAEHADAIARAEAERAALEAEHQAALTALTEDYERTRSERDTALAVPGHRLLERLTRSFFRPREPEPADVVPEYGPVEPAPAESDLPDADPDLADKIDLIAGSGLFDPAWYRDRYPDATEADGSPIAHFLASHAGEARDPGPAFSTSAYLDRYPDIREAGENALLHFLTHGRDEGREIFPVETAAVIQPDTESWSTDTIEKVGIIETSGLFDAGWYLERYADVREAGTNPALHYLNDGAHEGRDPGPGFDTSAYLDRYPDVREGGTNPLVHFALHGREEGRIADSLTMPDPEPTGDARIDAIIASGLFDAAWYLDRYPDVREGGTPPALHYLLDGAREGRDPGPDFDTSAYLDRYPDVREGGTNPLLHFVLHGRDEGRLADPVEPAATGETWSPDLLELIRTSGLFDADWYLDYNDDVAEAGVDPLLHYLNDGADEGRDPGPKFITAAYLERYPDVRDGGQNPLVHYILHGIDERREIGPIASMVAKAAPVAEPAPATEPASAIETAPVTETAPAETLVATETPPVDVERLIADDGESDIAISEDAPPATADPDQAQIDAIATHALFDAAWYLSQNPEALDGGGNAARHFHRTGAAAGRDPGPDFNSFFYLRTNSDVRASGTPAFVHYLEYGEAEGRRAKPLVPLYEDMLVPSRPMLAAAMLIGETRLAPAQVTWLEVGGGRGAVRFGGAALGKRTPALGDDAKVAFDVFARLHDWPLEEDAGVVGPSVSVLGGLFAGESLRVADLWFRNDHDMRMRVDAPQGGVFPDPMRLRVHQAAGDGLLLCGEGLAQGDGPLFVDIRTRNPFFPLLITAVSPDGALLGATVVPFPSLLGGGAHRGEVVALPSTGCRFEDVKRLSEALLVEHLGSTAAPTIATVSVDPQNATGAERIFSSSVREWLARIAHVRTVLGTRDSAVPDFLAERMPAAEHLPPAIQKRTDSRARRGLMRLALPCDALPTVTALFGHRVATAPMNGTVGIFVVADPVGAGPSQLVILSPEAADGLDGMQPVGQPLPMPWLTPIKGRARTGHASGTGIAPVAIRYHREKPSDAGLLFRRAPDTIGPLLATTPSPVRAIDAIIAVPSFPERLPALLQSLTTQTMADVIAVTLVVGPEAAAGATALAVAAEHLFPGRHRIVMSGGEEIGADLDAAAVGAEGDYLLFADETVLLHDPRTIETLVTLAQAPRVASAGCLQVHELREKKRPVVVLSSGLFPERDAGLTERTAFAAFPRATYPSAGNSFRLALIGRDTWRQHGRGDIATGSDRAAGFAIRTLAAGYRHLTTSAVSVSVLDKVTPVSAAAAADEGPAWQAALAHAPQIRDIRS